MSLAEMKKIYKVYVDYDGEVKLVEAEATETDKQYRLLTEKRTKPFDYATIITDKNSVSLTAREAVQLFIESAEKQQASLYGKISKLVDQIAMARMLSDP
jgi:hypothetical protein